MQTVAFKIGNGKSQRYVLVETSGRGNVPRNAARKTVQKAAKELEEHLDPIVTVAESIRKKLNELNNPGKISIEFGIELGVGCRFSNHLGFGKGKLQGDNAVGERDKVSVHGKDKIQGQPSGDRSGNGACCCCARRR